MTYTAKDIEVFFFAHNRANMLRQAVDCYLNQTVKGAQLILLVNAPSLDVLRVAQDYISKGVKLIVEPTSLNVCGCVQYCQKMASRAITVMAHDDDLIHPAYLETILKAYNQLPGLNLVISAMGDWNDEPFSPQYHTQLRVLKNVSEFSAYIFLGYSFTFSSASYRTLALKKAPVPNYTTYGKVHDVPFMLGVCRHGEAAVLQYPFIKYRIHADQDSLTFSTGPMVKHWLALEGLHKKLMSLGGKRLSLAYELNAYHRLRIGWRDWCLCEHDRMTFKQYIRLAKEQGLLSIISSLSGAFLRGALRRMVLQYLFSGQVTNLNNSSEL